MALATETTVVVIVNLHHACFTNVPLRWLLQLEFVRCITVRVFDDGRRVSREVVVRVRLGRALLPLTLGLRRRVTEVERVLRKSIRKKVNQQTHERT